MTTEDTTPIRRLSEGDEHALAALVEGHWSALVRYAYGLLGDWDVAEDVGQEAYARLWANRARWTEGSPVALLYRVARNACLDVLKSPRRTARARALDDLSSPDAPDVDAEASELAEAAVHAIEALPARRREVFRLVREGGLSYAEVAEVTGLSRQTVANHMSLALSDLRVMLGAFLSPPRREAPTEGEASRDASSQGS